MPQASISSFDAATSSPTATSQVIVKNGKVTIRSATILVDSICSETITPKPYIETLNPDQSANFTVNFDCSGVTEGEYPATYSLQLASGKIIASKTYSLKVTDTGVTAPNVVILSATSSTLSPGETGTLTVALQNSGNASADGSVALSASEGLSVTPESIPVSLQPGEQKNVLFKITALDHVGLPTGNDILTGFASLIGVDLPSKEKVDVTVNYETSTGLSSVSKSTDVTINPRFPYFLVLVFVALAAGVYFYSYRRTKPGKTGSS
jgi:uncharacterized repeat protein (TIGR01451 family)